MAGEPHSEHPACLSPVLGAFLREWRYHSLSAAERGRLDVVVKRLLPRCVGTVADGADDVRAWMCVSWLAREFAPGWMESEGRAGAATLRALPEITAARADELREQVVAACPAGGASYPGEEPGAVGAKLALISAASCIPIG